MVYDDGSECVTHYINCCTEAITGFKSNFFRNEIGLIVITHRSQSTAIIIVTSSAGKPTVSRTITIVIKPAFHLREKKCFNLSIYLEK